MGDRKRKVMEINYELWDQRQSMWLCVNSNHPLKTGLKLEDAILEKKNFLQQKNAKNVWTIKNFSDVRIFAYVWLRHPFIHRRCRLIL